MRRQFIKDILIVLSVSVAIILVFMAFYESGNQNVDLAAKQGDSEAQFNLGLSYSYGEGVPQNYADAVAWYRKAAEQGLAKAQNNLGRSYSIGEGVTQDDVVAYMWFNLAASQGIKIAQENRDIIAKKMTPSQIAKAQKLAKSCLTSNYNNC